MIPSQEAVTGEEGRLETAVTGAAQGALAQEGVVQEIGHHVRGSDIYG